MTRCATASYSKIESRRTRDGLRKKWWSQRAQAKKCKPQRLAQAVQGDQANLVYEVVLVDMALVQQDLEEQGLHVHVDLVAIRCAGSASSTLLHIDTDCSKPRLAGFHEDALNFSKRFTKY